MWDQIFEQFSQKAPVSVMMRGILANVLAEDRLNRIFEETTQQQYTRTLTFAAMVALLTDVVTRTRSSTRRAYEARKAELGVSAKSVYEKINHTEPGTSAAFVAATAHDMEQIIHALGTALPPSLPGYRVKILDGNHFSSSHRRLKILRGQGACLPGQALAVLDPQLQLILGIVPCVDGHAQERSLVGDFLDFVEPNDVWLEDRNFCTTKLLFGIAQRQAFFVVRQHGQSLRWHSIGDWSAETATPDGSVSEQEILVETEDGQTMRVRRIRLRLAQATRDGDEELFLLTNLPPDVLETVIAKLYRCRWQIETAFQEATVDLMCEIPALGHPQAAIFVFAVAIVCLNAFSVLKAALRTQLPAPASAPAEKAVVRVSRRELGDEFSTYCLAEHISGMWQGIDLLLPEPFWSDRYQHLSTHELAAQLRGLAQKVPIADFRKRPTTAKRSPTRPKPKPGGHVATARLQNPMPAKK